MKITSAYLSENGGREVNEDSVLTEEIPCGVMAALADGLGGHGMGDIASRIAVCFAAGEMRKTDRLSKAFEEAQDAVLREQELRKAKTKMKTTLCLLKITGETVLAGHIGDSRIYYFKNGKIQKRTQDHSVPQMLVNAGEIREEEIRFHEDRNRVTRVIGVEWDEPLYELENEIVLKRKGIFGAKLCYAFLLCTDGWWELVLEDNMEETLKASATPKEWLSRMKELILRNGRGREMDNYTAAAIFIEND